jgi:hypothetical protein
MFFPLSTAQMLTWAERCFKTVKLPLLKIANETSVFFFTYGITNVVCMYSPIYGLHIGPGFSSK